MARRVEQFSRAWRYVKTYYRAEWPMASLVVGIVLLLIVGAYITALWQAQLLQEFTHQNVRIEEMQRQINANDKAIRQNTRALRHAGVKGATP